jgi:hypothetical protein
LCSAGVRAAAQFTYKGIIIKVVPVVWQQAPKTPGWPRAGPHTELVNVINYEEICRLNKLDDSPDYCCCINCILPKLPEIRAGNAPVPIHVDRTPDLAVLMLRAFCAHFNTPARMMGVYAEARKSFEECDGVIERMITEPVRSSVWIEVPVLVALEIVVSFDVRVANIGGNIRAQPPKNLLEVVLDRFRHDTTPYCSW